VYGQLLEKPSLGLHFADVDLRMPFNVNMEQVTSIFKMILNCNIKSIRGGESTEPETYGVLLKLAQKAPFKYAQVEYLPKPLVFGQVYYNMLQIYKTSLKHISVWKGSTCGIYLG